MASILLPQIPSVIVHAHQVHMMTEEGEMKTISHDQAKLLLHKKQALVCHAPYVQSKLELDAFYAYDVLELFAFVHPAKFCVPTVTGLCRALDMPAPQTLEDQPYALMEIAQNLLSDLAHDPWKAKADPLPIAKVMGLGGKGWGWTPYVCAALGETYEPAEIVSGKIALNVWKHLPEWSEEAPPPPPSHHGVTELEAEEQLTRLLHASNKNIEPRVQQIEYTKAITHTFEPKQEDDAPHILLAEAGTGTGKTLGYLAPASLWAEKNKASVWISTYTKNLQRQIDSELNAVYPEPQLKSAQTAIRKGRENYMCLLNFEDIAAAAHIARSPRQAIAAGIMARWNAATTDGDLSGADFPGWLASILGYANTLGLADRRGECIYSACDHYKRCFVERSIRKSKHARIVTANHALVMITSALATPDEELPSRYIFDEGHHLFGAADSAFAAHLTVQQMIDFRRWILGAEGGRRTRARGLKKRAEDLCEGDTNALELLEDIFHHARFLVQHGWKARFKNANPQGDAEIFLYKVYEQVQARTKAYGGYSVETHTFPLNDALVPTIDPVIKGLKRLQKPMQQLAGLFRQKLKDDEGTLASDTRKRLDIVASSLERRASMTLQAWIDMLNDLKANKNPDEFVTWMEIERVQGRTQDLGIYRHHVDPMKPFAESLRPHLHGMAITSATLMDSSDADDWLDVEQRTGASYLAPHIENTYFASPFDFKNQTKIFIANDVNKTDIGQIASAYKTLFKTTDGGGLGLFTAINRLQSVYEQIASDLENSGIPLYAQHTDDIDTGTLIDMFRDDIHSCLLGTDAVRDGVDIPGHSLRIMIFDRVPWPRPTILHKARREAFGGRDYDERLTRLKLKQAFGRLIRRADDKGVFVMLDPSLPTRLQNAFPPDVEIVKCGLSEIVEETRKFLS